MLQYSQFSLLFSFFFFLSKHSLISEVAFSHGKEKYASVVLPFVKVFPRSCQVNLSFSLLQCNRAVHASHCGKFCLVQVVFLT